MFYPSRTDFQKRRKNFLSKVILDLRSIRVCSSPTIIYSYKLQKIPSRHIREEHNIAGHSFFVIASYHLPLQYYLLTSSSKKDRYSTTSTTKMTRRSPNHSKVTYLLGAGAITFLFAINCPTVMKVDGFMLPQGNKIRRSWKCPNKNPAVVVREDVLVCKMAPDDIDRPRKRDIVRRDM